MFDLLVYHSLLYLSLSSSFLKRQRGKQIIFVCRAAIQLFNLSEGY